MNTIDLTRFPRRTYSSGPTPLERLEHFSAELAAQCPGGRGPEVWVKRDDQLGLFPGGNKTRKLEFLAADALVQGADTLVTCGAPQSNHCRITLSAAIREGLRCRLVIEERVPGSYSEEASGNHFLFRLMGVEKITVVPAGSDMAAAMQREVEELSAEGRTAYVIPGGGSNATGGLGYVACAAELQQQMAASGLTFDAIVVGSGSSGTHGGLLAGLIAHGMEVPLYGIGVSRDPADQVPLVEKEALSVLRLLDLEASIPEGRLHCVGGYWQPKYSLPNEGMMEAVHWLARSEGLLLDPVYTGKIMAGLIGLARRGEWVKDQRVLFIHTGGMPTLFQYREILGER